jgi:hypothetical protein
MDEQCGPYAVSLFMPGNCPTRHAVPFAHWSIGLGINRVVCTFEQQVSAQNPLEAQSPDRQESPPSHD